MLKPSEVNTEKKEAENKIQALHCSQFSYYVFFWNHKILFLLLS